jgi:acid stress-induced BolA-like protein IbaG/YrbA
MEKQISEMIVSEIADAEVAVVIDGNRALITVVSAVFEPMSRVQKQQAVYGIIGEFIQDGRLHAVTIRALTPGER